MSQEMIDLTKEMGISKTVYSLIYPETRVIVEDVLKNVDRSIYEDPWTKKQDSYHVSFLNRWVDWSKDIVKFDPKKFHAYPSNGSSESIHAFIAMHANYGAIFHVFEGEYEGYEAYVKAYSGKLVRWNRDKWREDIDLIDMTGSDRHVFLISQPSSIDGNVWTDFNLFLMYMAENHRNVKFMVDLCYVGCVPFEFIVNLNHPNVEAITFSLSKVFGVYYHRIGGIFSRNEIPSLYGNQWFKNLLSLSLGEELLKSRKVTSLGRARLAQEMAIFECGIVDTKASDVVILSHKYKSPDLMNPLEKYLARGRSIRYCLSPKMDEIYKRFSP